MAEGSQGKEQRRKYFPRWFPWVYFPLLGVWVVVVVASDTDHKEWIAAAGIVPLIAFIIAKFRGEA
jgi:hypothetical protein